MSEENANVNEGTQTEAIPEPSETLRESKAFQAVTEQVKQERARAQELEEKLNQILATEEERKKAEEAKALEERGEYQTIIAKREAEFETREQQYRRELTQLKLETELTKQGCVDDLVISGAFAGYDNKTDISEYVAALKEKNPHHFAEPRMGAASAPAQGGNSGGIAGPTIEQVKACEKSDNREERGKARAFLRRYHEENGKYPY